MVISRTPVRIYFTGGGSDLLSFYQHHPGLVVNAAIDKYIYITSITEFAKTPIEKNDLGAFGDLLHQNWGLKKQITAGISNERIDRWYKIARKSGALGSKIIYFGDK